MQKNKPYSDNRTMIEEFTCNYFDKQQQNEA